ncbi:MAG: ATP-binding protein [Actinomycetota bacterium]
MIAAVLVLLVGLAGFMAIVVIVGVLSPSPAVPSHRSTTAHLQALYPFQSPAGLGGRGCYVGQEVLGGSFCYDPWELYRTNQVTNPNIVVAGQIGRGKSSLVKTYIWRQSAFGRRAVVIDPKGEFTPLAERMGGTVIRLEPGSNVRLNPLDPGPSGELLSNEDIARRQEQVLMSLAESALRRDLHPEERTAIGLARQEASQMFAEPTIGDVVDLMLSPSVDLAASVNTTPARLAERSRDAALELRRLCEGDLRGMFDGPTTVDIDWDGPIVVLDLSALGSTGDALGLVMACAMAWLHSAIARADGIQRILLLDEAWYLLSNLALARWLRSMFKLSRQYGLSNIIVVHRMSDLEAAGGQGSEATRIAQGLLSDTETRVVYAQSEGEVADTKRLLGLTDAEAGVLPRLGRGVALWKVRQQTFIVDHRVGDWEWEIIDTDQSMRTEPPLEPIDAGWAPDDDPPLDIAIAHDRYGGHDEAAV